jgi:hypothetical protein
MFIYILIIKIVVLLVFFSTIYMLIRNTWVYNIRMEVLHEDFITYCKLPSYDNMLYKYFYIWNKQKFLDMIK